jgi:hypothetical protein
LVDESKKEPAKKVPVPVQPENDPREEEKHPLQEDGEQQQVIMREVEKSEEVVNISASQLSRLRQTPARALGKGTPIFDKAAPARAAK